MKKYKFADLQKIGRSDPYPDGVNGDIRTAIKEHIRDLDLLNLFNKIEQMRWYGRLVYPNTRPVFEFTFRHGVCQCFTREIVNGDATFELNKINDAVDFGKEKKNEAGNNKA